MREQAEIQEKMLAELQIDPSEFNTLLGNNTNEAQPMELGNNAAFDKFEDQEKLILDYDYKYIDGIYRKCPNAIRLPVRLIKIFREVIIKKL